MCHWLWDPGAGKEEIVKGELKMLIHVIYSERLLTQLLAINQKSENGPNKVG